MQKTVKNLPLYCWILSDLAIIFLLSVYLLIHSFFVQNYLTQKLTNLLSDKFNIFSTIGNVEFSSLNSLKIKAFYLEDDRKDTLFYTDEFSLKIDLPKLLFRQKIYIKNIEVMGLKFYLKNQPEEKKLNLQFLIQQIQQKTAPSTAISTTKNKENMAIFLENFQLKNSRFIFKDHFEMQKVDPSNMDYFDLDIQIDEIELEKINFDQGKLTMDIKNIAASDKSGSVLQHFSSPFVMTGQYFELEQATLLSTKTYYHGSIRFDYAQGFSDFLDFVNQVKMTYVIQDAYVYGEDIAHFTPVLKNLQEHVMIHRGYVSGIVNDLKGENLKISLKNDTYLEGDFLLKNIVHRANTEYLFSVDTLRSNMGDLRSLSLYPNWDNQLTADLLPFLVDKTDFQATASAKYVNKQWSFESHIYSRFAKASGEFLLSEEGEKIEGNIKAKLMNLKEIDVPFLDSLSLDAYYLQEKKKNRTDFQVNFQDIVSSTGISIRALKINGHKYQENWTFSALGQDKQHFDFSLENTIKNNKIYDFQFNIAQINLQIFDLSKVLHVNTAGGLQFSGTDWNTLNAKIQLEHLNVKNTEKDYDLGEFFAEIQSEDKKNTSLKLTSSLADAHIEGSFQMQNWKDYFSLLLDQIVSFKNENRTKKEDQFSFLLSIKEMKNWVELFNFPLYIQNKSQIKGIFNEKNDVFNLEIQSDSLRFENQIVKKLQVYWDKKKQLNLLDLKIKNVSVNQMTINNINLFVQSSNQKNLSGFLNWFNDLKNRGNLNFNLNWDEHWKKMIANFENADMILDGKIWDLDPNAVLIKDHEMFSLQQIILQHEKEKIILTGDLLGKNPLQIKIIQLDLGNYEKIIFDWTQRKIKGVFQADFSLVPEHFLDKDNWLKGKLNFDHLEIDAQNIGKVALQTYWTKEKKAFSMYGSIIQDQEKSIKLNGFYYIFDPNPIQLALSFNQLDVGFLSAFLPKELGISNFDALLSGNIQIKGNISKPNFTGNLNMDEGSFHLKLNNLLYKVQGNILLRNYQLFFKNFQIEDVEKNKILLSGKINFEDFNHIELENEIESKQFLFLNTTQKYNPIYFGKIYASTKLSLKYQKNILQLIGDIYVLNNSKFSMYLIDAYEEKNNGFVRFRKKNQTDALLDPIKNNQYDVQLNFSIDPSSKIELGLDNKNTNLIKAKIDGDIRFKYTPNHQILLYGGIDILEGEYTFDLQGLISKKFLLQPGGNIRWNGPIEDGKLNIQANYVVRASPKSLVENTVLDSPLSKMNSEEFYCIVAISDQIISPTFKTKVSFARTNLDEQVLVDFKRALSSETEMMTQFASLLILGQFLPNSKASNLGQNLSGSGINTGANFLTGSLSNFISSFFSEQIDLKLKYNQDATGNQQAEVGIEAPIIKDRLIFKGSAGVSQRQVAVNTDINNISTKDVSNLIGNFDLEYKVTKNFSVKIFNQINNQNSLNTLGQDQSNYTQGLGMKYKEDFNQFKDIKAIQGIGNLFKKKKKKTIKEPIIDSLKNNIHENR